MLNFWNRVVMSEHGSLRLFKVIFAMNGSSPLCCGGNRIARRALSTLMAAKGGIPAGILASHDVRV